METLTVEEAYLAMFAFIEKRFRLTSSNDLAGFLGGMSLLEDGHPADQALQGDWDEAVSACAHRKCECYVAAQ